MAENSIYTEIKRRIVLLDYEPGQVLREKDLIEEFGVSRTPVRESLIRLEAEGLVRIFPNQGTIVSEVSFQQLKDVFEIRSFLVRLTGQLAAARITQKELDRLRGLIDRMKSEKDPKALMRIDSEVHDLVNQATKNDVLVKILGMLRDQAVRIWTFSRADDDYYGRLPEEFEELLKALEARDEDACAHILEKHTRRFIEHIRSQLTW
ncbi:MAG: GntR family transcriptional regulator [Desulfobacteraceae bacterium]|jgi:GntR family transcriptional regulator, rspAB operon transcriptional repressor